MDGSVSTPTARSGKEGTAFHRRGSELYGENRPVADWATRWGTPLYVYSAAALDAACRRAQAAFRAHPTQICFAVKANSNLSVLRRLFSHGVGADIVSSGELARVRRAGLAADSIVFSGVGKTDDELREAVAVGVGAVQIESLGEIERLRAIASGMGKKVRVGLRVNPEIEVDTHKHLITAESDSKFGIPGAQIATAIEQVKKSDALKWVALSCHLGSQIDETDVYGKAAASLVAIAKLHPGLEFLDLGGGFAVGYRGEAVPACEDYAAAILPHFRGAPWKLWLELGRALVADAGVLVTRVIDIKRTPHKNFVVIDAAMNDLIRPPLYEAYHHLEPLTAREGRSETVDVVGPVCESADCLAPARALVVPARGDLLAFRHAGAYGASMGSRYNSRPLCAEALIDGDTAQLIRRRESPEDQWRQELVDSEK